MRVKHLVAALAVAAGVALGAAGIGHALMPTLSSPVPHVDPCHVAALMVDPCAPLDTTQATVAPAPSAQPMPAWCFYDPSTGVWESEVTDDGLCTGQLDPNYHEGDDTKVGA